MGVKVAGCGESASRTFTSPENLQACGPKLIGSGCLLAVMGQQDTGTCAPMLIGYCVSVAISNVGKSICAKSSSYTLHPVPIPADGSNTVLQKCVSSLAGCHTDSH